MHGNVAAILLTKLYVIGDGGDRCFHSFDRQPTNLQPSVWLSTLNRAHRLYIIMYVDLQYNYRDIQLMVECFNVHFFYPGYNPCTDRCDK